MTEQPWEEFWVPFEVMVDDGKTDPYSMNGWYRQRQGKPVEISFDPPKET